MTATIAAWDELAAVAHWICWRLMPAEPKPRKIPISPHTGRNASSTDAATWGTFRAAMDWWRAHRELAGLGFVFSPDDPYTGVDLDHCRDAETGELSGWARAIIGNLDSYTELSPSATGVHVIVRAVAPAEGHKHGHVEMYDRARFFTMTGVELPDTSALIADRQAELEALHAAVFGADVPISRAPPPPLRDVPASDSELCDRMFASLHGLEIRRLWQGTIAQYGDDDSDADCALVSHLAYWAGNDPARIDQLFRQSALYRDKWNEQRGKLTYGARTIARVLGSRR